MGRPITGAVALALVVLAGAGPAAAQRVPLQELPAPVMEAVRTRFKEARVRGAAREIVRGSVVYEVALVQDGRTVDVTLTPEGAILLVEREIGVRDLPAPVREALESRYPGATYKDVEEVITVEGRQETLDHYAVELLTAQRKTLDLRLSPDGKFLR